MEQVANLKRTYTLAPFFQTAQFLKIAYLCLSIDRVWLLDELCFKRHMQKCTMSHVLKLIMRS